MPSPPAGGSASPKACWWAFPPAPRSMPPSDWQNDRRIRARPSLLCCRIPVTVTSPLRSSQIKQYPFFHQTDEPPSFASCKTGGFITLTPAGALFSCIGRKFLFNPAGSGQRLFRFYPVLFQQRAHAAAVL